MASEAPYPRPTSPAATATMKANRRTDTRPELLVRSELHRRGRRFRKDRPIRVEGGTIRPDLVFSTRRVAVFIDGCYWHGCELHHVAPKSNREYWSAKIAGNRERDRRQARALRAAGWRVLRIWEHVPPVDAADMIESALESEPD